MLKRIYAYRFELFLLSQLFILFGSLIFPLRIFEAVLSPVFLLMNLLIGVLLLLKKRKLMWFMSILVAISVVTLIFNRIKIAEGNQFDLIRMSTYFLLYLIITYEIISQVWQANYVGKNVIFGLISGYISLGLIGFFICLSMEIISPGSYQGIAANSSLSEGLLYYAYITLITIGYGEIIPVTAVAQKAAILIGLMGQIYLVVLTAIVVGKYINQSTSKPLN